MSGITRKGDTHKGTCSHGLICCPHSVVGTIVEGSLDAKSNGKSVARQGDKVVHNCPHCGTGHISEGSDNVKVNGKKMSRVGDTVIYPGGTGKIVQGSDDSTTRRD